MVLMSGKGVKEISVAVVITYTQYPNFSRPLSMYTILHL